MGARPAVFQNGVKATVDGDNLLVEAEVDNDTIIVNDDGKLEAVGGGGGGTSAPVDLTDANVTLDSDAYNNLHATDAFTANRTITLPTGVEGGRVGFVLGNSYRLTLDSSDTMKVAGSVVTSIYCEVEDAVLWMRFAKSRWVIESASDAVGNA